MRTPVYVFHQLLCPKRRIQIPATSSVDLPKPARSRSGPGSYEVIALALGPSVHETWCASSKSGVSLFPQSCQASEICWPSKPNAHKGSSSWCYTPRMRRAGKGSELSKGELLGYNYSPVCGFAPHPQWGVGINYIASVSFLLSLWHILCRGT